MLPNARRFVAKTRTLICNRDQRVFNLAPGGVQKTVRSRFPLKHNRCGPLILTIVAAAVLVQCAPAPNPKPPASSPPAVSGDVPQRPPAVFTVTAAELGATWRPGCPVPAEHLRRVELDYLGFDGGRHRGDLVVNVELVDDVIAIFDQLERLRYPIEKMRTVDHYPGADDELSMEDNNTSAFNCRPLPHGDGWSLHAYGRAVDLNPLINPYIDTAGDLQPRTAGPYLDRRRGDPAMLHAEDPAVRAFTERGWRWGGYWRDPVDYQHFERP